MSYTTIRVLLIEDVDVDRKRVETLLRYSGYAVYDVVSALTLLEGMVSLRTQPAHVALVDLSLPDADGIQAVVDITHAYPDLPVVVLTAHDDLESGVASIRAGAQDYVVKSEMSGHALERAIIHAYERKATQNQVQKFYKQSMRTLTTEDAADAAELVTQNRQLMAVVESAQSTLKTLAPEVHKQIQQKVEVAYATRPISVSGLPPLRETLHSISRSTPEMDAIDDPRSVLLGITEKTYGSA